MSNKDRLSPMLQWTSLLHVKDRRTELKHWGLVSTSERYTGGLEYGQLYPSCFMALRGPIHTIISGNVPAGYWGWLLFGDYTFIVDGLGLVCACLDQWSLVVKAIGANPGMWQFLWSVYIQI